MIIISHTEIEKKIEKGGLGSRPPTQGHRDVVSTLAGQLFTRNHVSKRLKSRFPGAHQLEDRQVSNLLNDARRLARNKFAALGGDANTILQDLEKSDQAEPGWDWRVRFYTDQSPVQAALARRFPDILDNTYNRNRNRNQLPLNIGIIRENHAKSRNIYHLTENIDQKLPTRVLPGTEIETVKEADVEDERGLPRPLEDAPGPGAEAIPLPEDTAFERIDLLSRAEIHRLLAETPAIQENIKDQTNAEGDDTPPGSLGHNEDAERTDAEVGALPGTGVKKTAADPLGFTESRLKRRRFRKRAKIQEGTDAENGHGHGFGRGTQFSARRRSRGTSKARLNVSPGTPTKDGTSEEEGKNREDVHDPGHAIGREEDPVRTDAEVPGLQDSNLERIAVAEPSTVESHRSLADENSEEVGNIFGGFGDEKDQEGVGNGGPA
ncbi:hypothetical protein DFH09DRAFT_1079926 [Mycena vulgaris]|nr:hypothetical protein DFH09DRAFT_1079926 [Mycena vulgaris]